MFIIHRPMQLRNKCVKENQTNLKGQTQENKKVKEKTDHKSIQ